MIEIPSYIDSAVLKDHITAAELAEVVEYCEDTRAKVLDEESGEYTGYKEDGNITLWVCYKGGRSGVKLVDYYFNRTKITGVSYPVSNPDMPVGPMLEPIRKKRLQCCKCEIPLEIRKVLFKYTAQSYYAVAFACPVCGQVYESKEIILYQANKVEALLEGK
jgi:hypothetical protein